jgi:8-oxo-dGTP diphosphatase
VGLGKQIFVVAAIVERNDEVLITQRFADDRFAPNLWEFPGGKVNFGEDPAAALSRELQEELGISVTAPELFRIDHWVYGTDSDSLHVILASFKCELLSGVPKAMEVQAFRWEKIPDLGGLQFAPADLPIVRELAKDFNRDIGYS